MSWDFPEAGSQCHPFYLLLGASGSLGQAAPYPVGAAPCSKQHSCAGAGGGPHPRPMFPRLGLAARFGCPGAPRTCARLQEAGQKLDNQYRVNPWFSGIFGNAAHGVFGKHHLFCFLFPGPLMGSTVWSGSFPSIFKASSQ